MKNIFLQIKTIVILHHGHCRYRKSSERAREPDESVVHDPSARSDRTKPEREKKKILSSIIPSLCLRNVE